MLLRRHMRRGVVSVILGAASSWVVAVVLLNVTPIWVSTIEKNLLVSRAPGRRIVTIDPHPILLVGDGTGLCIVQRSNEFVQIDGPIEIESTPEPWWRTPKPHNVASVGWPRRCMRVAWREVETTQGSRRSVLNNPYAPADVSGAIMIGEPRLLSGPPGKGWLVPYRPQPLASLINVLLYAAAWFGVLTLPVAAWRFTRRRKGSCTGCGYDLTGIPETPFPECGSSANAQCLVPHAFSPMHPDDHVCLCFRVSLRKIRTYLKTEDPPVASLISECLGAGTGCQWCVPFLKHLHAQHQAGETPDLKISPERYAEARLGYHKTGDREILPPKDDQDGADAPS